MVREKKEVQRAYRYCFEIHGQQDSPLEFTITLDSVSQYITSCPVGAPQWARLSHHQCQPCTLDEKIHPYCPVAISISELVAIFGNVLSHTPCTVTCYSPERTTSKETVVQEGLSSILGLLIAVSGCPVMDFFKPLARFHLPFSTVDESIFRIAANYFLRQYFKKHKAGSRSLSLAGMTIHYAKVRLVNRNLLERIRDLSGSDADKNAIVTLNSLAQILEYEIESDLDSLRHLFAPPE